MTDKYSWICFSGGYYVFEDIMYQVGKPTKFWNLSDHLQDCNYFCITRHVDDARRICDLLNGVSIEYD